MSSSTVYARCKHPITDINRLVLNSCSIATTQRFVSVSRIPNVHFLGCDRRTRQILHTSRPAATIVANSLWIVRVSDHSCNLSKWDALELLSCNVSKHKELSISKMTTLINDLSLSGKQNILILSVHHQLVNTWRLLRERNSSTKNVTAAKTRATLKQRVAFRDFTNVSCSLVKVLQREPICIRISIQRLPAPVLQFKKGSSH